MKHYITNEDDERSLNGNTVSDICVDEFGGIWVSTSTNGISYLDPNIPDVRRMKHEQNNANSLKSDHINVIFQDSEGDCWYGTKMESAFTGTNNVNGSTFWMVRSMVLKLYWLLLKIQEETSG